MTQREHNHPVLEEGSAPGCPGCATDLLIRPICRVPEAGVGHDHRSGIRPTAMRFFPPRSAWTTGLGTTLAFGNWGALPWVIGALVEGAGFKPDAASFLGTVELSLMGSVMLILAPKMPRLN